MLAPLKDRRIIEQEGIKATPASDAGELGDLRQALRESRNSLKRAVRAEMRQRTAMQGEIDRLQAELDASRRQLASYESGVAIIELGRELVRLKTCNDCLRQTQTRMWRLEKNLESAHCEYQRLFEERNALAARLRDLSAGRS